MLPKDICAGDFVLGLSRPAVGTGVHGHCVDARLAAADDATQWPYVAKIFKFGQDGRAEADTIRHIGPHASIVELTAVCSAVVNGSVRVCCVFPKYAKDLFAVIEGTEGGLGEDGSRGRFRKVVEAVAHMHGKNCAHLDIKPENILVDNDSNDSAVVLADFGHALLHADRTALTTTRGTRMSQAPELAVSILRGTTRIVPACSAFKADMWSLGALLFMMLTGTYVYQLNPNWLALDNGSVMAAYDSQLQRAFTKRHTDWSLCLRDLLLRLLTPFPDRRPSAAEVLDHPWLSMPPLA